MTATLEAKVHDFLAQKRIAVAGVSRDNSHHPVGNLIYRRLRKTGHDVFPVNPHMQTFEGERCYPDLKSIRGGVDGVVIVTRPEAAERIVQDCTDAGVRRVWMHQSMGRKGSGVSPAAVEYCRQHGISVIAGACPMMYGDGADFGHRCMRLVLSTRVQTSTRAGGSTPACHPRMPRPDADRRRGAPRARRKCRRRSPVAAIPVDFVQDLREQHDRPRR